MAKKKEKVEKKETAFIPLTEALAINHRMKRDNMNIASSNYFKFVKSAAEQMKIDLDKHNFDEERGGFIPV